MENLNYIHYGLILLVIFILIVFLYFVFTRVGSKKDLSKDVDINYLQGLEALVDKDYKSAIDYLKKAARTDSSSIGPFLVLGDILRERSNVDRAMQIHRELTVRSNLDKATEQRIYRSLILDYLKAERYNQVISAAKRLLSYEKNDKFSLHCLLEAYEEEGRWEDAIETAKTLSNIMNGKKQKFLAYYQAHVGKELLSSSPEQSEKYLKNSISLDNACIPAYIYLGDNYFQKNDIEKALEIWNQLITDNPDEAHFVFERIEKAYFEQGSYGQLVELYEQLQDKLPGDGRIPLKLSEIYRQKGEFDSALASAKRALEINPESSNVYSVLVEIYLEQGKTQEAIDLIRELLKQSFTGKEPYVCSSCQYHSREPIWRCPDCKKWQMVEFNI